MRAALLASAMLLALAGCGGEEPEKQDTAEWQSAKTEAKQVCGGDLEYPIYSTEWTNCVEDYTKIIYDRR